MPYGSGLSGQIGVAVETTVGTEVTPPTTYYEFLDETFQFTPTWLDGKGLKAGQTFKRVARTVQSRFDVPGGFTIEVTDQGHMGLLFKHAMGSPFSTPTLIAGSGTAYQQIHTPGPKTGLGLSVQVGRPQTNGVVQPFTYRGVKFSQWDFSCNDNAIAELKFTCNGWQQDTTAALGAATYAAGAKVFDFADATTFTLGGTVSTTGGVTSISGGTALSTVCTGITITHKSPLNDQRYGLGNAGVKKEQIENGIPDITINLDGEFTLRTELYDLLVANTTTALEVDFLHGTAGTGQPFKLGFIFPAVKIKSAAPNVNGPDILKQTVALEAYDDGSGTNPVCQVMLVSTDTAL